VRSFKKIAFLFLLLIPFVQFPQSSKVFKLDSLCSVWNDTSNPDTIRLHALHNVIWEEYLFVNPDSGIFYAEIMNGMSAERELKAFMAISSNLKGIAFQIKGQNDSAVKCFTRVKNIFEEINNIHGVGVSLNNIALALKDKGDFEKCLAYFNEAYELYKEVKDSSDMGSALHNIGTIYSDMGNNPIALQYFHNALKIGEKIKDSSRIASAYQEIGVIVLEFENNEDKALDYFLKSLQLRVQINDKIQIPGSLISISEVYKKRKDYEKALSFLNRALKICQEIGEKKRISKTYIEIGSIYFQLKNYKNAIDYFEKAKEINEFVDYKIGIALALNKLGMVYQKLNLQTKAISTAKVAYNISNDIGDLNGIELSTSILYQNHKKLNQIDDALKMYELNVLIKDSIINQDNLQSIINQQYQYEYEKKSLADSIRHQDEIVIHQAEFKAEQEQRKKQRVILFGVIILLTLIGVFSVYLYTRFRLIRRQRNLINEQKKTVDKAFGELGVEKKKVERKNKQIITSINYAKKIQRAILPENELMQSFFSDHFVLFQPKDIVGGNFYWYRCFGDVAAIACVDCTGHGVPGGFMSMMGSLLLDKIVQNDKLTTAEILGQLNNEIIRVLKQDGGGEIQDGMDLSLCVVDKKKQELLFSGARNGIYIINDGDVKSYKADLLPAGGSFSKKSKVMNREFTSQKIKLKKSDWVTMFSDGYPDQLGGDRMMSMGGEKFEEILKKTVLLSAGRNEFLMSEFDKWKGEFPKVDDLLVIGFKV
jgi:tetratricopeptide (TPR) repeat protein